MTCFLVPWSLPNTARTEKLDHVFSFVSLRS